jgi:hypothetical protein
MLVNLKTNIKIGNNLKRVKPSKDLVRKLYWDNSKTLQEIADISGYKNISSISIKMKNWNIPTRTSEETCMIKYGVKNSFLIEEVKEKIKKTNLEKFGVENPMQNDKIKEKKKQTCLDKYGVEYPIQNDEIKEKAIKNQKNIMNNQEYYTSIDKRKETCLEKYGVEYYFQKHIKNYDIWNNFDKFCNWIKNSKNDLKRKITSQDIVNFFNVGIDTAIIKLHTLDNIKYLQKYYRINTSYLELIVENWIKQNTSAVYERNKKYDFLINKNGNMMQLDFFFPELKIAVEVNDNWSHSTRFKVKKGMDPDEGKNYEQIKSNLCKANGIKLIHLWEDDIDNIDIILGDLIGK